MTRRLIDTLAPVLTLVAATTLFACSKKDDAPNGTPAGSSAKKAPEATATRVEVAVWENGDTAERIVRPGEVEGAREATLAAALGGYIERVLVESGQSVNKGQIIARVDTSTHAAELTLARVELSDAERELARLKKMGKAVPSARVDAAETRLLRAQAQERLLLTKLSRATIRAPFAGVLVDLQIEQGEVAAPGAPVGRLLVLDPIAISVSVTDLDIGSIKEGDVASATTAGSPNPVEGKVVRIEPAADLNTRTFLVKVEIPNPDRRLLPGMIAAVEFNRSGAADAQVLPQDLLVTTRTGNGVFVVDAESKARWRPLQLGSVVGDQVEVVGGLKAGERIVSVGHRALSEGDAVLVAREGTCCRDGRVFYGPKGAAAPSGGAATDASPARKAQAPAPPSEQGSN